jgi:threonylcarbamoyladenosine tRNA methylthiotransferase CDKAL1
MKKFYVEGYGCSLNIGETEQISSFLEKNKFKRTKKTTDADFIIINTCSVKMVTEQRMLFRIKKMLEGKKTDSKIIITGCLAATNKKEIQKISEELIILDTKLESLCEALGIKSKAFSPKISHKKSHAHISIIPISVGCLGDCTYCATRIARGNLKSYTIEEINNAFEIALKNSKEIWITSQDLGCYGFDINTNLIELLKTLLKNKGDYRIRLGMMNPNHFLKIKKELIELFKDERLFKFLHLPLQAGSDKVLKKMNRKYSQKDYLSAVEYIKKKVPDLTISTDVIVGFPGETNADFEKTLLVLKKTKPLVVNISKYGKRKGTVAATLPFQLTEKVKKDRSRKVTAFIKAQMLIQNKKMIGKKFRALVSDNAPKVFFVARTNSYRPVVVPLKLGEFVDVEVTEAFSHYFKGKIL